MNIEPVQFFNTKKTEYKPAGIKLTENAYVHINRSLEERNGHGLIENMGIGIRFGVTGAGCGGYSYVIEFVDKDTGEDYIFDQDNVKIFIDKKSMILLDGLEVDFETNGFNSGLKFNNPHATHCGCGESFTPATRPPGTY